MYVIHIKAITSPIGVFVASDKSGPVIHVDVTFPHTTYLSIAADQVQPFMETILSDWLKPLSAGQCTVPQSKKCFRDGLRSATTSLRC